MSAEVSTVSLICVKEGNRLRIKITSDGYYNDANCMFPKNLRVEGARYLVPVQDVSLITRTNKYYYSVKKNNIKVLSDAEIIKSMKVFEDADVQDCAICLENPKNIIIRPCGHFYLCSTCSKAVTNCPICRSKIIGVITKDMMD